MSDAPYQAPSQQAPAPAPQQQQQPSGNGNGFGIASLVLGIVTMVGFAIPFLNYVTIATGVVGVVLGIVGLVIKFRPRKAAIAGLILSGLGLLLSVILAVIYTAAFAGAAEAISKATVPPAGSSASAAAAGDGAVSGDASFKNGVLTTSKMKIEITSHRVIPVGQPGNEYGEKPVIAFVYTTTNLTNKELDPTTAWIGSFEAYQDNDPNAVNELNVGSTPGEQYLDTQTEQIKQGGTVENAVAYELDDETTAVKLSAKEDLFSDELGSQMYELK
ncbi:DUF5067 domain-containing protein [Curtobacterium sp. SP.BCp]|uniref:DUF5067 domain-containing protein n=1 Tax=Curtobacterium sp. SP.BCp TaxID=3435230 RepID=UPI003F74097D